MVKRTLRVVLWDQLSDKISSLEDADPKVDTILFMGTIQETTYVKHHLLRRLSLQYSGERG